MESDFTTEAQRSQRGYPSCPIGRRLLDKNLTLRVAGSKSDLPAGVEVRGRCLRRERQNSNLTRTRFHHGGTEITEGISFLSNRETAIGQES
jgi:hypothetical protein